MYPGTKFVLEDTSNVAPVINQNTSDNRPLYFAMFTSNRGPEKFTELEGSEWATTYLQNNTPNFTKHGQPLLQAALCINAGARMFSKRIVADNAKLGSATLCMGVSEKEYEVVSYTKATAETDGAKKVVSTTHVVDEATEVDIAKLGSLAVVEGDKVKSFLSYKKQATDTGIEIVSRTKSRPTNPATQVLDTDERLTVTGLVADKSVGAVVYPYETYKVSETIPDGEDGWVQGIPDSVILADGTKTAERAEIDGSWYKKDVTMLISKSIADDNSIPVDEETALTVESSIRTVAPSGCVFVDDAKASVTAILDGLTSDEKASIQTYVDEINGLVEGDYVANETIYYKTTEDAVGAKTVVSTTHALLPNEINIADIRGIVVVEGDYVVSTTGIEKSIVIRPMLFSLKNTDLFYSGVTTDKENLYQYAKKDIRDMVLSNETYTKSIEEGGIILTNGDNESSTGRKEYRLYTDPAASIANGILYPIATIYDVGRGVSDKLIQIEPNYSISKSTGSMTYTLNVIDATNSSKLESWTITIDAAARTTTLKSTDIQTVISGNSLLIDAECYFDSYEMLMSKLAEFGIPSTVFSNYDILNKRAISGKSMGKPKYTGIDGEEYILATPASASNPNGYAIEAYDYDYTVYALLKNGENGDLDCMTANPALFYRGMHEALTGVFSKDIYNLDLYAFDCIFDANYDSAQVKLDIQNLAIYRGDCTAFMDMGTEVGSLQQCKDMMAWDGTAAGKVELETSPKYCYKHDKSVYVTSVFYDQKNPYDGRQIQVTSTMGLATRMVSHYIGGFNRPFAGQIFNVTFPEAIRGTVNYLPKIYPNGAFTVEDIANTYPSDSSVITNEKQELEDIKVNYASYYNDVLTMDTLYTTYSKDSELSYVNNVLTVQKIMKAIRNILPSTTRYGFMDGDSLIEYKGDIQNKVIDKYAQYFASLKFEYFEDKDYVKNKIFYGGLVVQFKPFSQSEIIKVTVVNNDAL